MKISTKKGKTPYMVTFSSNPNTKQASASKGFGIGKKAAVLNASVEYANAIKIPCLLIRLMTGSRYH